MNQTAAKSSEAGRLVSAGFVQFWLMGTAGGVPGPYRLSGIKALGLRPTALPAPSRVRVIA